MELDYTFPTHFKHLLMFHPVLYDKDRLAVSGFIMAMLYDKHVDLSCAVTSLRSLMLRGSYHICQKMLKL